MTDAMQVLTESAAKLLEAQAPKGDLPAFGQVLVTAGRLPVDEWAHFLEKPWKWAREYALWRLADKPLEDDPDWDAFLEQVAALTDGE